MSANSGFRDDGSVLNRRSSFDYIRDCVQRLWTYYKLVSETFAPGTKSQCFDLLVMKSTVTTSVGPCYKNANCNADGDRRCCVSL